MINDEYPHLLYLMFMFQLSAHIYLDYKDPIAWSI